MPENLLQTITIKPRGVENTRRKVAGLFAAFREGADEATEAGDSVLGRIKGIGKSAKVWIAGVAMSAIAALTAGLAKAASTAIKFEENLQKVGTLIDGDVTGTLDRFAEGLDRIRQQLPVTTDLTRALYDAISAGIPEENAIGFLDDAARAATAGMTDTKTAVDALTSALNAYGKEVEETEEISDSFFQAIEAGKTTFPELASEMGKVLPLASSLGVEIDEVNAALATLTASGRSTSEAGTELRQILNSLIKEGERFRSVGIDINEVLDERGLFGVLQRVREETGGSSQEMRKLFRRVQALNGAITLGVENNQKFADTLGLMEEKAGATDEAVQQMEKSVSSLWQTTRNQLSTLWRQLGEDVLPTLNSALRATVGLLDDASSTDLDRLIQTVSEMQGIDSGVEERLRAVRRLRRAEERVEEARGDRQGEIVTGVDLSTRPSTLRRGELSEMNVEELRSRLQAVNEALAERANRVAELEAKEGDLSEVQQQTLDMARRRRSLLETARKGLLEGIETLTRYEAAQKAVTQARQDLNDALSEDPAAQSGGGESAAVGAGEPSLLQRLSGIENVDELDPATRQAIGDWVEALQSNLKGEIKAMQEAAGAQDVGLLGVDVEEMVNRIGEARERLEQGDINPAQFAEEARSIAAEYRSEIEKIIDRSVQLTTLTEEQGKRMKQGLKPARDEAQKLRADFIQTIGDLRGRGKIGQDAALEITKAIKQADDQTLKTAGSLDEFLKRLEQTGEAGPDAINAVRDAMEESTEQAEDFGKALQDTARFVRGIGDLASQFGDLSDEAEAAIDSTATLLSNVGRLIELKNQKEGFSNIFSSFSGAVSGIGAILGAAGGLASLLSASGGDGQPQKKMEELRKKIDENVRALQENTEAVLEQARVGENMSRRTLDRANELISQIVSSEFDEMSSLQQDRLLTQLENLAPMFEDVPGLLEDVETYFMGGQPISDSGQIVVSDQYMRQLAREFVLTDATAQDIVDRLEEKTAGISTSGGLTKEELLNQFGNFSGIGGRLAEIEEQFAQFSDTMSGVIEELNFRRQELGATFEQLRSTLTDRLPDLGFSEELIGRKAPKSFTEILQSRIEEASRGDLEEIRQKLAESLAGDRDLSFLWQELEGVSVDELLGDVTPSQFEDFLDQLGTITDVGGDEGETDFSTSATVQRTITEHQANQLLAFQRELVQLGREQLDALTQTTILPFGPGSGDDGGDGAPVGIPAGLQETIAAAEANGFRPPTMGGQRSMKKIVNEGRAVYNIEFEINGEMSAERTARKVRQYLDEYLPRG
jgi:TP901 family phage tail tape measure protein